MMSPTIDGTALEKYAQKLTPRDSAASAVPALEINDLTVAYDDKPVLWDVDLKLPQGVMCGIVGPNGAGKSTLIKAVIGLVPAQAGDIRILGKPRKQGMSSIAYVPQRSGVDWDFPVTVLDTVLMGTYGGLGWIKRPGKVERARAVSALERVGMADFMNRPIGQLSGGQQQRSFLARALVQEAPILLMDEPFQGVDAMTETAIVSILHDLRAAGRTIVVVHHDLHTLEKYFDWLVLLRVKVMAAGPIAGVLSPEMVEKTYA